MPYKVIVQFFDLQDGNHNYQAGDEYPRLGFLPSEERISELLSGNNRLNMPLIANNSEAEPKASEVNNSTTEVKKPRKRAKKGSEVE